jgi:C4-dicarboxylate-specific signal transduction histidine kinase
MVRQPPVCSQPKEEQASVEDRFSQLSSQFELLRAQVHQAQQLATLGTAAAMLAHEVNNLLTPIRAYVDTALNTADTGLMKKALAVTSKNVQILIRMSGRVLEISAAKARKSETVQVRRIIEDAVGSLCRDPAKDGIDLVVDVDETLTVYVDPLQLQQVLFNLMLNAREAMASQHGGRLVVHAERQGSRTIIELRNTGDPIPAELVPHLFEPFQTSKPSQREGRQRCGGLGLALCRDLIEENDGAISVISQPHQPTTFRISLPAKPN